MECAGQKFPSVMTREALQDEYTAGERDFHERRFDGLDLSNMNLSQCNFSGSTFVGTNCSGCQLKDSNLTKTDFTRANLSRSSLTGSDLSWSKLSGADLVGADLHKITARAANFSNALMIRTKLNDADCLGAIMTGINATAAQMESMNLECANLTGSALMNANLCGANCSWTNLSDTRLNWAIMSWCQLEAADLENANMTGVNLQAANLSFANLDNITLTGADLFLANLSGTLLPKDLLPTARLSSSRLTSQTYTRSQWPRELLRDWQRKGAIILDFEALPRDVQAFIREGDCNLRVYFNFSIDHLERTAIEILMAHATQPNNALRILSIANEKSDRSQIAFYSSDIADIEKFVSCLRKKSWQTDPKAILDVYNNFKATAHFDDFDVLKTLDEIAAHIYHIQALIPVSSDDRTTQLQTRLEPGDSKVNNKTQISWSSVSLPKVQR